jgi:pre-60S factor REI1
MEEEREAPLPDLAAEVCMFCNFRCSSVEAALVHQWRQHGFHIPDVEYLVDLRGLLRYCAEKVKVGCVCLYCNGKGKSFAAMADVQRHMQDRGHCKLR